MKSRYLSRLDSQIVMAEDRFEERCILAERAAYLARLGEIKASREQLVEILGKNASEPHVRVSILVNIADGLCHYYEDMSPGARDRFQRARALAIASMQYDLQSRSAALIALLEYGSHHFNKMFSYLNDATNKIEFIDKQTLCRVCMLVGQTLHLGNRFDLSAKWYQRAKALANEMFDDAAMSAILYNMASIWTVNRRNADLGGILTGDKSRTAWIGASSTTNFDQMTGATGLQALTPLMQAQICSLEGRYSDALSIYYSTLPSLTLKALGGWQSWLLADMAWCNANIGNLEAAREGFSQAENSLNENHHLDDRAATLTRLSQGMAMLGEEPLSTSHNNAAGKSWAAFMDLQDDMSKLTMSFLDDRGMLLSTNVDLS